MSLKKYATRVWRLEEHNNAANKHAFYHVFVSENNVCVTHWGRINHGVDAAGGFKAGKFQTYDAAEREGLKQMYQKSAKGYVPIFENFALMADAEDLNEVLRHNLQPLLAALTEAREGGNEYEGAKDAVLTHYDDFVARAQKLMETSLSSGDTLTELDALEKVWADIEQAHGRAQVTLNLTRQAVGQRLVGGSR